MSKLAFNRHHVWYEKNQFNRDPVLKRLRGYAGMIILTDIHDHNLLHSRMRTGVPFPDRQVAVDMMREMPPRENMQPRDHQLNFAIGYLLDRGQDLTAEHLLEQREFIMLRDVPEVA